jgi:hypothetical protein
MPQFSLKRLFASFAIVAIGVAIWTWANFLAQSELGDCAAPDALAQSCVLASFPVIGIGLGNLFQKALAGGITGCVCAILAMLAMG